MELPSNRSLGFLITDAARLLRRKFEQESRDLDMTSAQLRIFGRLSIMEGVNQSTLAGILELEPMTLCRHIDRMEARGLVERRPDPADRRARLLYTTEKGRALLPEMRRRAGIIFDAALSGTSDETRRALIEGLQALVDNLSDRDGDDKPVRPELHGELA